MKQVLILRLIDTKTQNIYYFSQHRPLHNIQQLWRKSLLFKVLILSIDDF